MNFFIVWAVGTILCTPLAMHVLLRMMVSLNYIPGFGWENGKKPDAFDWGMSSWAGFLISCLAWPLLLVYGVVTPIKNRKKYKKLRQQRKEQRQKEAFNALRKARLCLLEQKRTEHKASTAQWTAAFEAADVRRIEAVKASRLAYERRMAELSKDRIAGERMYSHAKGYFGASCQHGNSLDSPCSHCLF